MDKCVESKDNHFCVIVGRILMLSGTHVSSTATEVTGVYSHC